MKIFTSIFIAFCFFCMSSSIKGVCLSYLRKRSEKKRARAGV